MTGSAFYKRASDRALSLLLSFVWDDEGRTLGEVLHDRQITDLEEILDTDGPRLHCQLKPRGAGKTDLVAAALLAIALIQAPTGARCYAAAADKDQARLVIDSIRAYVRRTPLLSQEFDVRQYEAECKRNGVVIEALAADTAGSGGLRPYVLVLDELFQWAGDQPRVKAFYEFLVTAIPKIPGSRLVVISTAPHPDHAFTPLVETARTDPRWTLNWWTEADGLCPAPWQDPADIAAIRATLSEGAYQRLFLNRMVAGADMALCSPEDIATLFRNPGDELADPDVMQGPWVCGLDLSVSGDNTGLAIGTLERTKHGQRVVIAETRTWKPTRERPLNQQEVYLAILRLASRFPGLSVVADPYQALGLLERLRGVGVRTQTFNFSAKSKAALGAMSVDLTRTARWSLPPDPDLIRDFRELQIIDRPDNTMWVEAPRSAKGHGDTATAVQLTSSELLSGQRSFVRALDYKVPSGRFNVIPDETSPLRFGGLDERTWMAKARTALANGSHDGRLAGRR